MARERDQFATALSALAGYAGDGRFGWGHPLAATTLAGELGLSPTPVREALAHLAGEGIIEHRPGRGYFAPSPSSSDIVELYEFHRFLTLSALSGSDVLSDRFVLAATMGRRDPVEPYFEALAKASVNSVIAQAQSGVAALLRPIRKVESAVAALPNSLFDELVMAIRVGEMIRLERAIDRYHEDRQGKAQSVFAAMRRSAQSIEQI